MSADSLNKLLLVSEDLKKNTLKKLNITDKDLDDAVRIVTEWFLQQPHLPNIKPDPNHIVGLYVGTKGSMERTKEGIDLYYSLKTVAPDIFLNRDPLLPGIKQSVETMSVAFYPTPTPAGERIVCCNLGKNSEKFLLTDAYKYLFMALDLRMRNDFTEGCVYIADMSNMTLGLIAKMTISVVKKAIFALQGPYVGRIRGCHFINHPSHAEPFIQMVMSFMKPKIRQRFQFHKNLESLYKAVDKNLLPIDFGGTQKSITETRDDWLAEMVARREWFLEGDKHEVQESKRPTTPIIDELLGMHGSFRKLDVD